MRDLAPSFNSAKSFEIIYNIKILQYFDSKINIEPW